MRAIHSHFVMAGLVPAIHVLQTLKMAWTYIVTNKPNGTLYVGVTKWPRSQNSRTPNRQRRGIFEAIRAEALGLL